MQKSRLPEAFLADMRQLLGDEYEHYLTSMEERAMSGLRVNTLKTSPEAVESILLCGTLLHSGAFRHVQCGVARHPTRGTDS